jgi:hypothetical protein
MSLRLTQGDENQGQIGIVEASISCPATKDGAPDPLWQGKKYVFRLCRKYDRKFSGF